MAIVKQYHKDTDTTYVYESTSYWDAEKGQSRSKRRVIGKIDPATGEIVPTGKRGRARKENTPLTQQGPSVIPGPASDPETRKLILDLELTVTNLRKRVHELESENQQYKDILNKAASLSEKITSACSVVRAE